MAMALTDVNISFVVNVCSEQRQFLQQAHPITMSSLYGANRHSTSASDKLTLVFILQLDWWAF
jgi:hypothetical protein